MCMPAPTVGPTWLAGDQAGTSCGPWGAMLGPLALQPCLPGACSSQLLDHNPRVSVSTLNKESPETFLRMDLNISFFLAFFWMTISNLAYQTRCSSGLTHKYQLTWPNHLAESTEFWRNWSAPSHHPLLPQTFQQSGLCFPFLGLLGVHKVDVF